MNDNNVPQLREGDILDKDGLLKHFGPLSKRVSNMQELITEQRLQVLKEAGVSIKESDISKYLSFDDMVAQIYTEHMNQVKSRRRQIKKLY